MGWIYDKLKEGFASPFPKEDVNDKRRSRLLQDPPADKRLVMMFTPRSGSSRIADLSRQTGVMSQMHEAFNPPHMKGIAKAYGARNMKEYIDLLVRARNTQGLYSTQVTYSHIVTGFGTGRRFLQQLCPTHFCWLIREDIIAQAISSVRMGQTGVAHSVTSDLDAQETANQEFIYNSRSIRGTILRLRWMEWRTEALFSRISHQPMRLTYEQSLAMSPEDLVKALMAHVDAGCLGKSGQLSERHQKISSGKSGEFAERFRSENAGFVKWIAAQRAPMLDQFERNGLVSLFMP